MHLNVARCSICLLVEVCTPLLYMLMHLFGGVWCNHSGMSRTHSDARNFVARGADVLSVPEFVRGFVGQAVTVQLQAHPGNFSRLRICYTVDGIEVISTEPHLLMNFI